ncbi:hypothetical protein DYB32_002026 [Aphanomyces invadans]|uniref:Small-subunit processome Utp12 domain-containing protein n=1 Tax=Aphanomyces invadans TaxID=157072 RepID=A0A3R7AE66_9STRA|nr:hypothetical protein DYB32_002026 [Aphanomyces invadans]
MPRHASGSLRQELKERDHLKYKYTTLAWTKASPWATTSASKKGNKRSATSDLGVLALGTTTGAIVVWNLEKGEVGARLARETSENGHAAAVTDLVFTSTGATLFSSSSEKNVLEWNVKDATVTRKFKVGSEGVSKLALSKSDDVLAVGNSNIKLFDVASGKKSSKLTSGHATAVAHMAFSDCSRYLFSSTGERFVNVFDVSSDSVDPLFNFSADTRCAISPSLDSSIPFRERSVSTLAVRVNVAKKAKQSLASVASVADNGAVFVWQHAMTTSAKPVLPATQITSSAGVVMAVFSADDAGALVVARGSIHKPHFETVPFLKDGSIQSASIMLTALDTSSLLDNALLEHCLRVHDAKVIDETCRRLNTTRVFPFLLLLVEKFEKRPTRGATMCQWIKFLMLNHTAYLMTVPDVIDKLSTLYQSLDARVKVSARLNARAEARTAHAGYDVTTFD